ncbi:tRNA (cytidine(34)-2'-O)-methyltransferase [Flaviflexus equikiangi]|uniref:Putative tRNA (cytidine(34)-2'-O)-methyltransferase n=1 Tax=Flaviflexus equikiangi TaxID=2758573 RepID=A0ABS2TF83_9ACTO|nr:tRNA (cytidine(34)-2'-O)-methyltransferase [Flaviflexus equikiangi]MBM9433313.1 tRNA (cytidine(34)-2'-O)-methyltransferase [Flaviflexus equikiangi]
MFDVVFFEPCIPSNTGNAIRLSACTGVTLHLVEPLGFNFSDANLRRAGLDYHDLASMIVHPNFDALLSTLGEGRRIFAFTGHSTHSFADVAYEPGDVLLFGPEPTGLPDHILGHAAITHAVRIPMQPHIRSLNLANSASIAVYEAWRQNGFAGAV